MKGATNVAELIRILRDSAMHWQTLEFEARREARDQDAEKYRKQYEECVNYAAALSEPAMEAES